MTRARSIVAILFALAACTPARPIPPGLPVGGTCRIEGLGKLIGQPATASLIARAKRLSGASAVRALHPGQIVTMEFREGRLNVNVDKAGKVRSFTCG